MLRKLPTLFALVLLTWQTARAQHTGRTITGTVTAYEDTSPLEGVLIAVKGTDRVSGSQADGIYYIPVTDKDSVLVFSHNEFETQEIKLTAGNEYNIKLQKKHEEPGGNVKFSPIGNWRGAFAVRPEVEIPFNFDIRLTDKGDTTAYFLNGGEQYAGGRVQQTADSLFIFLDQFDNELAFKIDDHRLSGVLRRQDKRGTPTPLTAEPGVHHRFRETGVAPAGNISGTYDIVFKSENGKEEKAVGLFKQEGKKLQATFLRVTGDSRYLEGIVEGNTFYLSSFIGSGPGYYKGSFDQQGQLTGDVGARGGQHFTGTRNEQAALPDAYTLTTLKEGYTSFDFSFPDADGNKVSLSDAKYKNKVVVVTITGTWCPNCMDETAFLAPWYKTNARRGVEAIALHYERQTDTAFVRKALGRSRNKYDIQYAQLIAGPADKQFVATSLPALNTFLSFPTLIFIDKKGKVARIHTGYSGPATGKYYDQFVKEFNEEIDLLLKQ
ncbi:TlpA family protein disulfide reductase [Paraflavitalea soli]|uniref:TlpA family protein disulfide reductase n=1 Tax=Paraflavitalea soli TaxID=2315862 RepID=A0A3B7MNT7_9BACT|nr:redoxin family protein [Paraflavitalea soli]AXY73225.1 TlpA family protein disulfide reductase [Paraflavitalea soli]